MSKAAKATNSPSKGPIDRKELTKTQRRVLDQILIRTYEIAEQEAAIEKATVASDGQPERRPRHVFYIDGARGAGKTTLLLTVREHLRYLGIGDELENASKAPTHVADAFRAIRSEISATKAKAASEDLQMDRLFRAPHKPAKGGPRKTALVFPVLFPSDLDDAQPIMEGLFAFMDQELASEIAKADKCDDDILLKVKEDRAKEGIRLQQQLHKNVTKSWFLSKQEGIDAILRDSYNYEKFLENRGRASGQSYRRVADWRRYVNAYLEYFGAQLLAVLIDDTDVNPQVSTDILHTMRIFFDHPRIVTVIAGNLRTLRQSLVWRAMSEVRSSMQALSSSESATATEWRRFLRREIEEYLDKVIPRQQRQFLLLKTAPGERKETQYIRDFQRIAGEESLDKYCAKQIEKWLKVFYRIKFRVNTRWIDKKREIGDLEDRVKLEYLLSWWLLRHWYKDKLGPRTPRELQTLISYSSSAKRDESNSVFKHHAAWREKRLAVVLFENAENYDLIHRFEDGDTGVLEWLTRQELSSEWGGSRSFSINGRKITEGTYSYNYICYRLDLGIAIPLRENVESDIPKPLLPRPAGRNLTDRPPFFPVNWQPKMSRLVEALNHSVIPANCSTVYDLQCLPDVAWRRKDTDDPWRPTLIYKWPEAFDLLSPRLATRAAPGVEHQQRIETYFFEVVLPLATLDIGRFVSAPDHPKEAKNYRQEHLLLWAETAEGVKFFKTHRAWLNDLRRRIDYISTSETALNRAETREIYEKCVSQDLVKYVEDARSSKPVGVLEHLVDYQWLMNDVRRAWHATRIFINHLGEFTEQAAAAQNKLPEHTMRRNFFTRSDRYRIVSLVSLIDEIKSLPPFYSFWLKASQDIGGYVSSVREKKGDREVHWDAVCPAMFIEMLLNSDPKRQGVSGVRLEADCESAKRGLLATQHIELSPFLFTGDRNGHGNARLSRVLFFLIVGLGPCFPAMIHMDIAGALYAGFDASERVLSWREVLDKFQIFCFRYRASMERFLLRVEHLLQHENEGKFEDFICGSAVPDWSFASLGGEGREGMKRRSWGELASRQDLWELLTGEQSQSQKESRSEASLFRDAESFLNNAQHFLSLIEEVVIKRKAASENAPLPPTGSNP